MKWAIGGVAGLFMAFLLFGAGFTTLLPKDTQAGLCGNAGAIGNLPTAPVGAQKDQAWSAEQVGNAATIANVAVHQRHLPPRAAVIAVATAMAESTLRNLPSGDRDSLGLFQQRPSQGWGTPSQILDPVYATNKFLDGLIKVPNWESVPLGQAAQAVQKSAYADGSNYAVWESAAAKLVGAAASAPVGTVACQSAGNDVPVAGITPGNPLAPCVPPVAQGYGPSKLLGEPAEFGYPHFHTGIDLSCPAGTQIKSLTEGVAHVTNGWGGGFGNNVVVELKTSMPGDSSPQSYFIRYAHMESVLVQDGQAVHPGVPLGLEGSTGYSTGAHLHLEIDKGAPSVNDSLNPKPLLAGIPGA